jgi:ubiquinone/menaquinone biosynthesis C-methylase UbiE
MIRHLRAWWTLLRLGPARRVAGQIEQYYRYQVMKYLTSEGLFDYLREPHSYGEVVAHFGFEDYDYTRGLFLLLAEEKTNAIMAEDGVYRLNPAHPPPTLEDLFAETDERYHKFADLAGSLARNVPSRLRRQPTEFAESFQGEGRELLQSFDKILGNQLYSVSRDTAFALLPRKNRDWLHGKSLLDVGCGSGRETAELWLNLNGDVHITAIDPVGSLLERAEKNFAILLEELEPAHPPLTSANRPIFREASATQLPFEDDTFDAAFHSHILHWTPDPPKAISEVVRVLKPGGIVFGVQTCKPYVSKYTDLVMRSNENCYGNFWREEFVRWYADQGLHLDIATPAGAFWARKPPP